VSYRIKPLPRRVHLQYFQHYFREPAQFKFLHYLCTRSDLWRSESVPKRRLRPDPRRLGMGYTPPNSSPSTPWATRFNEPRPKSFFLLTATHPKIRPELFRMRHTNTQSPTRPHYSAVRRSRSLRHLKIEAVRARSRRVVVIPCRRENDDRALKEDGDSIAGW